MAWFLARGGGISRCVLWQGRAANLFRTPVSVARSLVCPSGPSLSDNPDLIARDALDADSDATFPKKKRKTRRAKLPKNLETWLPPMTNPMSTLTEDSKVKVIMAAVDSTTRTGGSGDDRDGAVRRNKRKLDVVVGQELEFLAEVRFPLPSTMTEDQWVRLLRLQTKKARYQYLDALADMERAGNEKEGQCVSQDEDQLFQRLVNSENDAIAARSVIPPDAFAAHAYATEIEQEGLSESEAARRLSLAARAAQATVNMGRLLPPLPPPRSRDRREVLRVATSEVDAFSVIHFLAANARLQEVSDYAKQRAWANRRQMKLQALAEKRRELEEEGGGLFYGTFVNSIFLRVPRQRMERDLRWLAIREFMPWGSPMVIDLSFLDGAREGAIPPKFVRNIRRSLASAVKMNMHSVSPSALYFTNYDEKAFQEMSLVDAILQHTTEKIEPAYHATPASHLSLFPRARLVYLSPDSPHELGYDVCASREEVSEAVFVMGGLNESPKGMTLAQAEQQGIRHARLPMERHVGLSTDLSFTQVLKILNDFRLTRDWFYSMRWVPARFIEERILRILPESYLNPEMKAKREALTPGQYRRIYQQKLAKKGLDLRDAETQALISSFHQVDRRQIAARRKGWSYKDSPSLQENIDQALKVGPSIATT